jgi:hypothetical protein
MSGMVHNIALSPKMNGFERLIRQCDADLIMAHNIDTLLPAYRVARDSGALLLFDSMEFHSDMDESQHPLEIDLIKSIERMCLPVCSLITTSSHRVAQALNETYGVTTTLPLYNTPRCRTQVDVEKVSGFSLYWRNSTIGLSHRGLADAIQALRQLPLDISLHVQGHLPPNNRSEIFELAKSLGVAERLVVHPPCKPERAVEEAARFHVGLCLERKGNRNHELTVSNKMFDYHMAGLAVVSSDLPALHDIINRSQGGLVFRPGDIDQLTEAIRRVYDDRDLLGKLAQNARTFALSDGNLENEMRKFRGVFEQLFLAKRVRSSATWVTGERGSPLMQS